MLRPYCGFRQVLISSQRYNEPEYSCNTEVRPSSYKLPCGPFDDGVSFIMGVDTVRCSGNAIMDGRGNCIDLVEINPNIDEDLEDLFKSDNEKLPENGASDPNGIYTVRCSNGQVMDESSKIIILFLLALCF